MESGTPWNIDERTRSQTRAVLMALSRDRSWYFLTSLPSAAIIGLLTFGLVPLLDAARRFDRWRRLEWLQYADVMAWIADRTDSDEARLLTKDAEDFAGAPSKRVAVKLSVLAMCGLIAWSIWHDGVIGLWRTVGGVMTVHWSGLVFLLLLLTGWFVTLTALHRHQKRIAEWLDCVNEMLVAYDRRPVVLPLPTQQPAWLELLKLAGAVAFPWIGLPLLVFGEMNCYIRSTRAARMRFVERMLEWMDGGPMEYDVEELDPEQIATMM